MGNQQTRTSELALTPIPDSYVAISICMKAEIRIMNVTPEVREMLVRLDQEIAAKWGLSRGPLIEYYGTLKMQIGNIFTFAPNGGEDNATLEKFFTIRILEEMYNLGYNMLISSDLDRIQQNSTTWFFAKSIVPDEKRGEARVCCVAPQGGGPAGLTVRKLVLLHHDEHIKSAVMLALRDAWPNVVGGSEDIVSVGETLHEISLRGCWGSTHAAGINTRKTICNLVGRMGGLNWRLLASTNLRGTGDVFFFIYDPTFSAHPDDFCMLTLSEINRLRLINCNHLLEPLKKAITSVGFVIRKEKQDYHGCVEIQVLGSPWFCTEGHGSIAAQRCVSRIMEVFGQSSYTPIYAVDVNRCVTDKASILFRKNPHPENCSYACLSLGDVKTLRLLEFPADVGAAMRDCIYQFYTFGVIKEAHLPDSNLEISVWGQPWLAGTFTSRGSQHHMRAVLGKMMAVAAQYGWYVSISADVSSQGNNKRPYDLHSIYFVKMQ